MHWLRIEARNLQWNHMENDKKNYKQKTKTKSKKLKQKINETKA